MEWLAISAAFPISSRAFLQSFPLYPISFINEAIDDAGKPLHPTSTARIWTLHPLRLPSVAMASYFAFFISPETSILSSLGTTEAHLLGLV